MKQVIEVNGLSELREEEGKLYVCRRYDGGCDGNLWYKGDTTIERYSELRHECSNAPHPGLFFAFNDEQFREGMKSIGFDADNKESWKGKVFRYYGGMYGTHEGYEELKKVIESYDRKIAAECDPQEVYIDEYNNHECQYSTDESAYEIVVSYFGEDVAKQIKRF